MSAKTTNSNSRLDELVADTQRNRAKRELGYREKSLKMYPWVCGRCAREFTRANVRELTVHHRDHNHDYNPEDGSNWELLCVYCHDNEHSRLLDGEGTTEKKSKQEGASHKAFAGLDALLKQKK